MNPKLRRIVLTGVVFSLVLVVGGYGGYRLYKGARQARLLSQAREFLKKSEYRQARLVLQRAIGFNARDVEACRLMGDLAEAGRSPAALLWRGRVVELNPGSLEDRLMLARTALTFRDTATATNALEGVDVAGRKTSDYHNIAGTVAVAINRPEEAEAHFLEASRLEPLNVGLQLNLAQSRLHGTNVQRQAAARTSLRQVSVNPTNGQLRCQALRELISDAVRQRQAETAVALSLELQQDPQSMFQDRILRLDVLRVTTNTALGSALAGFRQEASTNSARIFELGMWQMANLTPAETLAWLRTVPRSEQTNPPAALLVAECLTILNDWPGLQGFVAGQNWADAEFLRRAYNARALRAQSMTVAAKSEWENAVKAVGGQLAGLVQLLRLASAWGWPNEQEDILWRVVNRYPAERWAFNTLSQRLVMNGRTRPLMNLYSQELKRTPSDLITKNNLAVTALLLGAEELRPHELAVEVYREAPTNSSYASTYALSLHLLGKNKEALDVMRALSPKAFDDPSLGAYYGLILKAAGDAARATPYLAKASKARLLPEERALFNRAGMQ